MRVNKKGQIGGQQRTLKRFLLVNADGTSIRPMAVSIFTLFKCFICNDLLGRNFTLYCCVEWRPFAVRMRTERQAVHGSGICS
jgi:hypothetical protein